MAKNAASETKLGDLHEALATVLIDALKAEGCTAATLAVAAKFLKDNDITCAPADGNKVDELKNTMAQHTAPPEPEGDATLREALEGVVNLEAYRNGTH